MSWFEFSLGRAARYRFAPALLLTLCLPALAQAQSADLAITKTDGVTTATPGGSVTYTITASNAGPDAASGATVADTFPASLTCTWTCVGAGGGTCTASGSGNISNLVNLPAGGSVTYTASCSISASATGSLTNTATVSAPAGVTDPTPGNNSATDTDTLVLNADLAITKTDGVTTATPGGSVTYTIAASNAGPSNATGATVADTFPASLTCTWTCVGAGGGTCAASGSGNISDLVNLPAGGSVTYTASCSISAGATGSLTNTATVSAPAGVTDPTPGNNSATDTDTLPPPITPIHDIQGNGASSPIVGTVVTIRGIVTGVKSNGFFVQEEEVDYDADPATSEGIFVFTSAGPPPAAAFSSQVQVTGTVAEFVPSTDPQQPPATQLTLQTVVQVAAGQSLPAAIPLSTTFPDPVGPFDQLERLEHMRVSAGSIIATGPSQGTVDEPNATGTSNGRFYGVITGVARPFREAGIQAPDVPPSGTIPPIPRWDVNPERLRIESAGLVGQPAITVRSGDVIGPIVGPLDYASRSYGINPDGTNALVTTPGALVTTVSSPAANEITVAPVNLRRFFDSANDPVLDEPVLTAAAFDRRLDKASMAIRDHLRNPDIIGLQEVENLAVLQSLASTILANGGPQYAAHLVEGNGVDGLDVGFLVKTNLVTGGVPRVEVSSVTEVGASTTWVDPSTGASALLNDRPPLVLEATVHNTSTTSFPVVVIVNDLLGLTSIASDAPDGLTTVGDRVRRKRQAQAEFLANYVQGRLTADPGEHLAVIGSFNAFEVNDGYADVMNVVAGTPPPDNETVVPGDGVDLVNPDLVNLVNAPAALQRYSVVLDGNAANLDHALVSAGLIAGTTARRIERPRIGADYPETELDGVTALRFSDRDPLVAYFASDALNVADLSVTKTDTPDPVVAGQNLTYTITVTNSGPSAAALVTLSDTLPADTTFVSLSAPGGWSCTTPAVGADGQVSCTIGSLGASSAVFMLTVAVSPALPAGTSVANIATATSATADPAPASNSAIAITTVTKATDVSIVKIDTPDPVRAGDNLTYTITVSNSGPSASGPVAMSDTLPAGTTFVSLTLPSGWGCSTPPVGAAGTVICTIPLLFTESVDFALTVRVAPTVSGTTLTNTARVVTATADSTPGNNSATAVTAIKRVRSCDVNGDGFDEIVTGAGAGGGPHVRVLNLAVGTALADFYAYDPRFDGGVFVACGDVDGDGIADVITGAGPGGSPHVRAFSLVSGAATEITGFFAYDPGFRSGVRVAAADVDGDGLADIITGAGGSGGPHVRAFSLRGGSLTEVASFYAYDPAFEGGVSVAGADVDGDGVAEIITGAGPGGSPHVRAFTVRSGNPTEVASFFAYDPAFRGGVFVAAADVDGNGLADIITGVGRGGGPHVRAFSVGGGSSSEIASFYAYDPAFAGGVSVAVADVDGDGLADIVTGAGPGGGPHVRAFSLRSGTVTEVASFLVYDPAFTGGVIVALRDAEGPPPDIIEGAPRGVHRSRRELAEDIRTGGTSGSTAVGHDRSHHLREAIDIFAALRTRGERHAAHALTSSSRVSAAASKPFSTTCCGSRSAATECWRLFRRTRLLSPEFARKSA